MRLPYALGVCFLARLDRVVNKSKVCPATCNCRTHTSSEEFASDLGFPISSSGRILANSEAKDSRKLGPSDEIAYSAAKSFSKFSCITNAKDRRTRASPHEPRREQNAAVGRLGRAWRHEDHELAHFASLNRLQLLHQPHVVRGELEA